MSSLSSKMDTAGKSRKIIHVDMDCFYAAIEIRDNPALANKPVAVGGTPDSRGVLCTCNYIARKYGVRSAMATATAYRHCKDLIVLPVNMPKYKQVSKHIQQIFKEFTELVEPLALDEAYLDVTGSAQQNGSATLIAQEIRKKIWCEENLTASAGVAPNKFLAKIASGWKKPNGLFVIRPEHVSNFVHDLPINKLFGVGKVTAQKLHAMNLNICADLQKLSLAELTEHFGKLGQRLYEQSRGMDDRAVEPNRIRKSLSVERTFPSDINSVEKSIAIIKELHDKLVVRVQESAPDRIIKNQYIKIKFHDFKTSTAEIISEEINLERYLFLFREATENQARPIRLLGLGVHFQEESNPASIMQPSLF